MQWADHQRGRQSASHWALQMLPLVAALLWAALDRHQLQDGRDWGQFLTLLGSGALLAIPMMAGQLLVGRLPAWSALVVWLAAFIVYPAGILSLGGDGLPLELRHFAVAVCFSAAALLADGTRGKIAALLERLPITLDGVAAALLALWALALTSLFGSTADAVNNQPLRVWFNPQRLLDHPLEFAAYLVQFGAMAALLFGFYWLCRYLLIRRVLRDHGWIAAALASLTLWIVYTPLACSLNLLLPVNPPDWSFLPSENHNPFDPINYGFSLIAWTIIVPLVLAAERLMAQRRDAQDRHERIRAELQLLHQQINPHFLFNSLNTIYALCLADSKASAEAVLKLSDLLRYTVYQGRNEWVGLDQEIACLQSYLDLQQLRFGSRCTLHCTWPADTARLRIPPLLLIMLVENAYKHGVEAVDAPVAVTIDLALAGAQLRFACTNTPLTAAIASAEPGLGLNNLRRRLELLFDDRFAFSSAAENGGWSARLEFALRPC